MTGPRSEPPMPMLITLRIGLPVCPFHSPERTRAAKAAIRSSTSCTCATTSVPSTISVVPFGMRSATCSTERFSEHVYALPGEHGVAVALEVGLLGKLDQQLHRLVDHPVLRVVQVQPHSLGSQSLPPCRVLVEELAQTLALDCRRGAAASAAKAGRCLNGRGEFGTVLLPWGPWGEAVSTWCRSLRLNPADQIVPSLDEGRRAVTLELGR